MKNLQETGTYLESKIKFNTKMALIFLLIGLVTLTFYIGIIFIVISIYFFIKRSHYKSGYLGEQIVIESLQNLPDSYSLINDVNLLNSYGNIDHVVLGNNGIFIIETKNFQGEIICNEDEWVRHYEEADKDYEIKSPSKQVKGNALKLKQYIESKNIFGKSLRIWVEGIVVFTNEDVILHCNNSTVPILKVSQLCNYILNKESRVKFSSHELEKVTKILLNLK